MQKRNISLYNLYSDYDDILYKNNCKISIPYSFKQQVMRKYS